MRGYSPSEDSNFGINLRIWKLANGNDTCKSQHEHLVVVALSSKQTNDAPIHLE